jgi:hypothetical protein
MEINSNNRINNIIQKEINKVNIIKTRIKDTQFPKRTQCIFFTDNLKHNLNKNN